MNDVGEECGSEGDEGTGLNGEKEGAEEIAIGFAYGGGFGAFRHVCGDVCV